MLETHVTEKIVSHMNEDHSDALMLYAKAFTDYKNCESAKMLNIDEQGIDIACAVGGESHVARVVFKPPLSDASEARKRLVDMVTQARSYLLD